MSSENPGANVDNAYAKLESMIRNFSREKMGLEEKVAATRQQVQLRDKDVEDKNEDIKILTLENDRLKSFHEEDGKSRFAVEAMVTSSEKKILLLVETLCSYDDKAQDLRDIHKMYEDFNDTLKRRHLLLNRLCKEEVAKNRELTISFQQELKQKLMDLETLNDHCTELTKKLTKTSAEKEDLVDQYLDLVSEKNKMEEELNFKLSQAVQLEDKLSAELSKNKGDLDEIQQRFAALSEELKSLLVAKEDVDKLYLELKDEKVNTEGELKNQLLTSSVTAENLKVELTQKTADFSGLQERFDLISETLKTLLAQKEEADKLCIEIKEEKVNLETQLSSLLLTSSVTAENLKVELTEKTADFSGLQERFDLISETLKTLLAQKEEADKLCIEIKEEKVNLETQLSSLLLTSSVTAENLKVELTQKTADFSGLQERFDLISETLKTLLAQKEEAEKLCIELKEEKVNLETELSNQLLTSSVTAENLKVELTQKTADFSGLQERFDLISETLKTLLAQKEEAEKLCIELKEEKTNVETELSNQLSSAREATEEFKNELNQKSSDFSALQERFDEKSKTLRTLMTQKEEADKFCMGLKDEKANVESEMESQLATAREAEEELKAELKEKAADLEKVNKRLNDSGQSVKELIRARDVLARQMAELTKKKETQDSYVTKILEAAHKWKGESAKKATALKALQLEFDDVQKQYQDLKKSIATAITKSTPDSEKLTQPMYDCKKSAPKASKIKPFRKMFSGSRQYPPAKSILRSNLDSSSDRKSVSFCSPVQNTWSSTPESSDESDNENGLSEIEADFSELKMASQDSGPAQKRLSKTTDSEAQSPAGKKVKTDDTPGTPSTETARKFFRRANRSPMTSGQTPVVPTTPRKRVSASQN